MSDAKYKSIVQHYESCLAQHGDSHMGVDWPNIEDANKRYQVMLELVREKNHKVSLLDFGCGASHLFEYMVTNSFSNFIYSGLDASSSFCELSAKKFPNNQYICLDALEQSELLPQFDYIVMNGVFTEKRELDFDEMFDYFKKMVRIVFEKSRKGIAFNVMAKAVDWERDDLFHLPMDKLADFLTKEISRNFIIRNDYGLYEYTTYVYRD